MLLLLLICAKQSEWKSSDDSDDDDDDNDDDGTELVTVGCYYRKDENGISEHGVKYNIRFSCFLFVAVQQWMASRQQDTEEKVYGCNLNGALRQLCEDMTYINSRIFFPPRSSKADKTCHVIDIDEIWADLHNIL